MTNEQSNPRHKIEAFKELRQTASIGDGAEERSNSDRFVITINLGADVVEHYNKSIEINPHDVSPDDITINLDEGHDDERQ
jgi:hypothetical protein